MQPVAGLIGLNGHSAQSLCTLTHMQLYA
jgi:hypothetical protein